MDAIAQIDLESCPLHPAGMEDVALVAVFCTPGHWPMVEPAGTHWVAREYRRGEALSSLTPPAALNYTPVPAAWGLLETDFPDPDEWPADLARESMQWSGADYDAFRARHPNREGHKLGGWAHYIQSRPDWPDGVAFVFQIAAEPLANMDLGDAGILTFARSPSGTWYAEMQCY